MKPLQPFLSPRLQSYQNWIFVGSALLLILAMLLNLGVQPLFLEEPRRCFISFEMLKNQNLWVPKELGMFYYKKPPFFNWILLISVQIFGGFSEFALRFPTVLSTLATSYLVYWMGNRYVNKEFGIINAFLYATCGSILFYFSTLAEIDLFYSLVTFASFATLFHFYQTQQFYALFLFTYLLAAIGFLTKGPPSVLFLGFSLVAWFIYKKNFWKLFSLPNFLGLGLFLAIVGGFLYIYSFYHPIPDFLQGLWGQSSTMTVIERSSSSLPRHVFRFSTDILKDMLPGTLLLLFALRKAAWKTILQKEWIVFGLIIFVVNIPVYLVSPGARQRYIYMLYPFLFMPLTWCYLQFRAEKSWHFSAYRFLTGLALFALPLAMIALHFIPDLDFLPYRMVGSIIGFLLFGALFYFFLRHQKLAVPLLILATILARIVFDLTILPQRAHSSGAQIDKDKAYEVAEMIGEAPLYLYGGRISYTMVYYLDVIRDEPFVRNTDQEEGAYYIMATKFLDPALHEGVMDLDYKGEPYTIFVFK